MLSDKRVAGWPPRYRIIKRGVRAYRKLRGTPILRSIPVSNKWLYVMFFAVIPSIYVTTVLYERTHTQYYLITGPKGGTYDLLGHRIAQVLNKPDRLEKLLHLNIVPDFATRESCGALDNLDAINRGLAQLGFAEDGLPLRFAKTHPCVLQAESAQPATKELPEELRMRALMLLYRSPLHIVARSSASFADVRDIPPRTKVYLGPEGSATEFVAQVLLNHYGTTVERAGRTIDFEEAAQAMLRQTIDAGFFLTALNVGAIQKLSQSEHFKLLSVGNAPSLKLLYPYLDDITIPASTFHGVSRDVVTVGTNTVLVASADLTDTEVYEAAKKIIHHIQDIVQDVPFNAAKTLDSDPQKELFYPLHEGAIRFYDHKPPFFLNPHALAGIGTYVTLLLASWKVSRQFIRNYRVHRILHAVDTAVLAFQAATSRLKPRRYQAYTQKLRQTALAWLKLQRITLEDYNRITEYIKGHSGLDL